MSIHLFDIVQSRFEQIKIMQSYNVRDQFSRSGVRLFMYQEPAGDLTICTNSHGLTNFVVNTSQNMYEN